MKSKVLTSLGVIAIAMALFFNTNFVNNTETNFDLNSLIAMNTANAEIIRTVKNYDLIFSWWGSTTKVDSDDCVKKECVTWEENGTCTFFE